MADDEDDKKTPEPTPEPEPHHEPPAPEPHPHDDLRATVAGLQEQVSALATTVQGLLPENKDESPVKKPWTHRRFGG